MHFRSLKPMAFIRRLTQGILLVAAIATGMPHAFSSGLSLETRVKSAFLYNFTKFIDWPSALGKPETAPFLIGVLGRDPLLEALRKLENKKVGKRPVHVLFFENLEEIEPCEILFVSGSEGSRLDEVIAAAEQAGTLTIGDTPGFARRGIMINFVEQSSKIRFEINHPRAFAAGFRISSRLLDLAILVDSEEARP